MIETFVCNASPLIALARLARLDLLVALAGRVLIPAAVLDEVAAGNALDGAGDLVRHQHELHVVDDIAVPEAIRVWGLGAGESQVLAMASLTRGAIAVLDDRAARRCATTIGAPCLGTIAVIALARKRDLIPAARPLLVDLAEQGFRLAPGIMEQVLLDLGE